MPSATEPEDTSTSSMPRAQRRHLLDPVGDGLAVQPAAAVGQQRAADLDDPAPGAGEFAAIIHAGIVTRRRRDAHAAAMVNMPYVGSASAEHG